MAGLPHYAPMLATAGLVPHDDARWNYEVKFDGIRAISYIAEELRIRSRNDNDITAAWPELAALAPSDLPFVIDGEIVALTDDGRSSFEALQPRMHQRNPAIVSALANTTPITYMIFDLLHIGDRSLIDLPYQQRRELLEQLDLHGRHWQTPPRLSGPGGAVLDESRRLGLEGIVCKRLDSPYQPGRRSPLWLKAKNIREQEVIVVGWKPGAGRRTGQIGSLLMAVNNDRGELVYIGNVGTGFTQAILADLRAKLQLLQRDTPVVEAPVPDAVWVEPQLVGEVSFTEWTGDGRLRHPSWRGLRFDKAPREVTMPS